METLTKTKVPTLRQQLKALLNEKDEIPGGSFTTKNGIKITVQRRSRETIGYRKPDSWNAEFTIALDKRWFKCGDMHVKANLDKIHSDRIQLEELTIQQVVEGVDKFQANNDVFSFTWDGVSLVRRSVYIQWEKRKEGKLDLMGMIAYTKEKFNTEYGMKVIF